MLIDKVYVSLDISEKRLLNLDDIIDLDNFSLLTDEAWEFIKSDKVKPSFNSLNTYQEKY